MKSTPRMPNGAMGSESRQEKLSPTIQSLTAVKVNTHKNDGKIQARFIAGILALLLFTIPAQAGPLHWLKQQFKEHPTRTAFVVGMGAATVHGLALAYCREGSVERCQSQYGAAWKSFGFATGANLAVIASTKGCWKDQPAKFCSLFAYGGSAAQLGFGINQYRKKGPEFHAKKTDFIQ